MEFESKEIKAATTEAGKAGPEIDFVENII